MTWLNEFLQIIGAEKATLFVSCVCLLLLLLRETVTFLRWLFSLKARARAKKRARIQAARRLEYTLPDEHNEYVRERLQTTLSTKERKETGAFVQVRYARRMLTLLKSSALSPVERLDVEEMEKALALYDEDKRWNGEAMKVVNEIFARLLKLSAKYEIAV